MKHIHVYPTDDLREHVTDGRPCWCQPTPEVDEPSVIVHHSMDGRENYETGERKPS